MADVIIIEGVEKLQEDMKRLSMSNPRFFKQSRQIMAEAIKVARKEVTDAAKSEVPNDPRKAYHAVRASVWRKVLGGNVNILARRKANNRQYVGGNIGQRGATDRTRALAGYYGSDRGFVLRFLNAGTDSRTVKGLNGRSGFSSDPRKGRGKRTYKGGIGNRGSIQARNWFKAPADASMQHAAEVFSTLMERAIVEVWNEQK